MNVRKLRMSLALWMTLLPLTTSGTEAQTAEGQRHFDPNHDYVLEIEGEPELGAEVFFSSAAGEYLLLSSKFPAPVLISARSQRVDTLNMLKVAKGTDGHVTVFPGVPLASQGGFQVVNGEAHFNVEGKSAALKQRPPVVGDHDSAQLRTVKPDYGALADTYAPSEPILRQLRGESRQVRLQVFFGTWCPFCGQMVPRIMKVAEQLATSNMQVVFHGLPRQIHDDPAAVQNDIETVPTGILYIDGREVGRISGQQWKVPELAINRIISDSS